MDSPCASCGAPKSGAQNLELALPKVDQAPRRMRRREDAVEVAIELAFDPRSPTAPAPPPSVEGASDRRAPAGRQSGAPARKSSAPIARRSSAPPARQFADDPIDVVTDATLLANHGDPPEGWIASAAYAWRVFRRRRELRRALSTRREEAKRAALEHEDALVAFAEQARPSAQQRPAYAESFQHLRRAEETLLVRRNALAAQNDADSLRLASIDARLGELEAERDRASHEERTAASDLSAAQTALDREEALLKRAETEARAAGQRERTGG